MAIKKITLILAALALAWTLTFSLGSDVARAQAGEVDEASDPARTPVAPVKEGYQEESIEIQDRPSPLTPFFQRGVPTIFQTSDWEFSSGFPNIEVDI